MTTDLSKPPVGWKTSHCLPDSAVIMISLLCEKLSAILDLHRASLMRPGPRLEAGTDQRWYSFAGPTCAANLPEGLQASDTGMERTEAGRRQQYQCFQMLRCYWKW